MELTRLFGNLSSRDISDKIDSMSLEEIAVFLGEEEREQKPHELCKKRVSRY